MRPLWLKWPTLPEQNCHLHQWERHLRPQQLRTPDQFSLQIPVTGEGNANASCNWRAAKRGLQTSVSTSRDKCQINNFRISPINYTSPFTKKACWFNKTEHKSLGEALRGATAQLWVGLFVCMSHQEGFGYHNRVGCIVTREASSIWGGGRHKWARQ